MKCQTSNKECQAILSCFIRSEGTNGEMKKHVAWLKGTRRKEKSLEEYSNGHYLICTGKDNRRNVTGILCRDTGAKSTHNGWLNTRITEKWYEVTNLFVHKV